VTIFSSLLEEALESWEYARNGVIDEVENLSEGDLDFRPTAASRSTREIVRHILESAVMWSRELSGPDGDFTRAGFDELVAEAAPHVHTVHLGDDLLRFLRESCQDGYRALRQAGELHMLHWIRRFGGKPGTRLAQLNHAIDHETYNRGQLALHARLVGRVPALTRRIR
jgi:uncharacterized damage-inducible protein DinB